MGKIMINGQDFSGVRVGGFPNACDQIYNNTSNPCINSASNVQDAIDELGDKVISLESVAKGATGSQVFDTFDDMETWLKDSVNMNTVSIGTHLYIRATDVADYWVSNVLESADANTGYYYEISELETGKVDLSDYATVEELGIELTQAEYDALPEEEKNVGTYYIIDADYVVNGSDSSFSGSASDVTYDGTDSGLNATNVQSAIDEVNSNLKAKGDYSSRQSVNTKFGTACNLTINESAFYVMTFFVSSNVSVSANTDAYMVVNSTENYNYINTGCAFSTNNIRLCQQLVGYFEKGTVLKFQANRSTDDTSSVVTLSVVSNHSVTLSA